MSVLDATAADPVANKSTASVYETMSLGSADEVIRRVQGKIAPVWPLQDYVAVNPFLGLADRSFLDARRELQAIADVETLMDVKYYRRQYEQGAFVKADVHTAIDEMVADGVSGAEELTANDLFGKLQGKTAADDFSAGEIGGSQRTMRTVAEILDQHGKSSWTSDMREEISKHCAAHYDEGQAAWSSPWSHLSLYEAWRSACRHDRKFEILGASGFRKLVAGLPQNPQAAVTALLSRLGVPAQRWEDFLLCQAFAMIGWSAWTKYQARAAATRGEECSDFAGLLAMRLAYECALSERFACEVDWSSIAASEAADGVAMPAGERDALLRYVLLRSSEVAYRRRLLTNLTVQSAFSEGKRSKSEPSIRPRRQLAQMVFCIDVRSERLRRHLETADAIETFGFAGFFGLPIEYVPLGQSRGASQVPALISPQFKLQEAVCCENPHINQTAIEKRSATRYLRKAWKEFQSSATSCFAFVETTGLFYGLKLLARTCGFGRAANSQFDGVAAHDKSRLGPSLQGLQEQGISPAAQADLAESILRGVGIFKDFARLVVFCGHGSQTENNPLQAGLDCGACGGHSGEANARFAAMLLNQKYVRELLLERGLEVPDDVHFVAALHNTTTDALVFFDVHDVPQSHADELRELTACALAAGRQTRSERLSLLPGASSDDLLRRAGDWSEIRPEWGLAGNAAFIAAPRSLTASGTLDGRSFLHSYDYRLDPEFKVLEQIMTAPLVVAHWINMQYYASTVDPQHFGSGNKAVHNVVGRFGIFSGNGGDLMTGLPWQSVHDGKEYQHQPLRLLAVLAAPRAAIDAIIARHEVVENLLCNGWLQLLAIEDGNYYRYTERQKWDEMPVGAISSSVC